MYRNFRIDGNDILNIYELQGSFSIGSIYGNLEQFRKFAKVHCKPLVRSYTDSEGQLNVSDRFNNSFWYDVLCGEEGKKEYRGYVEYLFGDTDKFSEIVKKTYFGSGYVEKEIIEECESFGLKEKLKHILEKAPEGINNRKNALVILAICELSDINALDVNDFSPVKENNADVANSKGIRFFPRDSEELILDTANKPYRYWYHRSDTLSDGEKIKTVKIKAKGIPGKKVIIELYSDRSEQLLYVKELEKDEFIYCNTAGGKIIKFFPGADEALSECKGYSEEEKAAVKAELLKKNVGVFALENEECSYLTIEKGKLNYLFYKPARMDTVKFRLRCITDNVVEVKITKSGYQLLTDKGTVIDKNTEKDIGAVALER